jgi:hypothetical protein
LLSQRWQTQCVTLKVIVWLDTATVATTWLNCSFICLFVRVRLFDHDTPYHHNIHSFLPSKCGCLFFVYLLLRGYKNGVTRSSKLAFVRRQLWPSIMVQLSYANGSHFLYGVPIHTPWSIVQFQSSGHPQTLFPKEVGPQFLNCFAVSFSLTVTAIASG